MYRGETDRSIPGRLKRWAVRASVCFTIFFLVIHFTPLVQWYAAQLAHPWEDSDGDILIVLANEQQSDDIIGQVSYWRAVYAVRAWRAGHFRAVVVSGGSPKGVHKSMAAVIGDFLACDGIPREKIFLEEKSLSTRENALFTKNMIGNWPGRKVLLTSDYHTFRALRAFRTAGLAVEPRPFPDILKQSNNIVFRGPCFWGLCTETAKIVWYWEKGWIRL
jgi:uncharacterized SAM-binding protein YcdF (DUF218 family)